MAAAKDERIIAHASEERRMIVTLDSDFHALLALSAGSEPTVLRIREEGIKGERLAILIDAISTQYKEVLSAGCVMSYHLGTVRYRLLPLPG